MASNTDWLSKNLIIISGKGGVGKTTLATAAARHLAQQGRRTLLVHVLQLGEVEQKLEMLAPNLWNITLRASDCFREYIIMKLKLKTLYTAFLGNKMTQYLERAAPGVREIVLLGKVWFERENYDHVVVDMPSTGYALTMVHTPFNFAALFPGGPIYHDSKDMIETFSNPRLTSFVVASLAEEMPVQESIELAENLKGLMPANPCHLILNRLVRVKSDARALHETEWRKLSDGERNSPLWRGLDFLVHRQAKQTQLLDQLKDAWAPFSKGWLEIGEVPAKDEVQRSTTIAGLIAAGRADAK
ncbi:MAG: ArsA family ATPase [Deltaproteobacteria bacterium]|nr:ArsA family ATPase [Deltaproteobacteria bacterium]